MCPGWPSSAGPQERATRPSFSPGEHRRRIYGRAPGTGSGRVPRRSLALEIGRAVVADSIDALVDIVTGQGDGLGERLSPKGCFETLLHLGQGGLGQADGNGGGPGYRLAHAYGEGHDIVRHSAGQPPVHRIVGPDGPAAVEH